MTNVLVSIRGTVDVSEELLVKALGRPDDDSDAWYQAACKKAEEMCDGDLNFIGNHLTGDLEAEAD